MIWNGIRSVFDSQATSITLHTRMESESENTGERNGSTQEQNSSSGDSGERPPMMKLRDLRPEKDPMGAGNGSAPSA